MNWLGLLRAVLALANYLAQIVRDKQLLDAGEAKATAKSLVELQKRLDIGREVEDEIANLSDQEARDRLKGDARG